jgi:hypothetical protein
MISMRTLKIYFCRLLGLIVICTLYGCQSPLVQTPTLTSQPPIMSTQKPSLRGTVINIYTSDNRINGFYAEGEKEPDTTYDKARIILTDKAIIFEKINGEFKLTNREALKTGHKVEVLFDGPIEESDPIRATAGEVVILNN